MCHFKAATKEGIKWKKCGKKEKAFGVSERNKVWTTFFFTIEHTYKILQRWSTKWTFKLSGETRWVFTHHEK